MGRRFFVHIFFAKGDKTNETNRFNAGSLGAVSCPAGVVDCLAASFDAFGAGGERWRMTGGAQEGRVFGSLQRTGTKQ